MYNNIKKDIATDNINNINKNATNLNFSNFSLNKINGENVELDEMLVARENRANIQNQLINNFNLPLVSFTLNIVGPIKVFPLTIATFEEGVKLIQNQCFSYNIEVVHYTEIKNKTGYEAYFVVNAEPKIVKKCLCKLEELISLGRIFDIDVINRNGLKISRTETGLPERKCLICDKNAFVCSRSRAHSIEVLLKKECEIITEYFLNKYSDNVAETAVKALIYEVSASPKPGLVDRYNSGSHNDMDFYTFQNSSLSLSNYFKDLVVYGAKYCNKNLCELFDNVRPMGILAEKKMYEATNGVNTHKGIIFSLGIFCLALGYMYGNNMNVEAKYLRDICKKMTINILNDFSSKNTSLTNGEKIHKSLGITGIRGEACNGYPVLFDIALPKLKYYVDNGYSLNDSGILTLLYIIVNTVDTNIISRSSLETLQKIKQHIQSLINDNIEKKDYVTIIKTLDNKFIELNISPGGSADILAMAYFLYFLNI